MVKYLATLSTLLVSCDQWSRKLYWVIKRKNTRYGDEIAIFKDWSDVLLRMCNVSKKGEIEGWMLKYKRTLWVVSVR